MSAPPGNPFSMPSTPNTGVDGLQQHPQPHEQISPDSMPQSYSPNSDPSTNDFFSFIDRRQSIPIDSNVDVPPESLQPSSEQEVASTLLPLQSGMQNYSLVLPESYLPDNTKASGVVDPDSTGASSANDSFMAIAAPRHKKKAFGRLKKLSSKPEYSCPMPVAKFPTEADQNSLTSSAHPGPTASSFFGVPVPEQDSHTFNASGSSVQGSLSAESTAQPSHSASDTSVARIEQGSDGTTTTQASTKPSFGGGSKAANVTSGEISRASSTSNSAGLTQKVHGPYSNAVTALNATSLSPKAGTIQQKTSNTWRCLEGGKTLVKLLWLREDLNTESKIRDHIFTWFKSFDVALRATGIGQHMWCDEEQLTRLSSDVVEAFKASLSPNELLQTAFESYHKSLVAMARMEDFSGWTSCISLLKGSLDGSNVQGPIHTIVEGQMDPAPHQVILPQEEDHPHATTDEADLTSSTGVDSMDVDGEASIYDSVVSPNAVYEAWVEDLFEGSLSGYEEDSIQELPTIESADSTGVTTQEILAEVLAPEPDVAPKPADEMMADDGAEYRSEDNMDTNDVVQSPGGSSSEHSVVGVDGPRSPLDSDISHEYSTEGTSPPAPEVHNAVESGQHANGEISGQHSVDDRLYDEGPHQEVVQPREQALQQALDHLSLILALQQQNMDKIMGKMDEMQKQLNKKQDAAVENPTGKVSGGSGVETASSKSELATQSAHDAFDQRLGKVEAIVEELHTEVKKNSGERKDIQSPREIRIATIEHKVDLILSILEAIKVGQDSPKETMHQPEPNEYVEKIYAGPDMQSVEMAKHLQREETHTEATPGIKESPEPPSTPKDEPATGLQQAHELQSKKEPFVVGDKVIFHASGAPNFEAYSQVELFGLIEQALVDRGLTNGADRAASQLIKMTVFIDKWKGLVPYIRGSSDSANHPFLAFGQDVVGKLKEHIQTFAWQDVDHRSAFERLVDTMNALLAQYPRTNAMTTKKLHTWLDEREALLKARGSKIKINDLEVRVRREAQNFQIIMQRHATCISKCRLLLSKASVGGMTPQTQKVNQYLEDFVAQRESELQAVFEKWPDCPDKMQSVSIPKTQMTTDVTAKVQ